MEFDPVGSAQFIPDMIKNDTLIDVLDKDQLNECLKHVRLNVEESIYILNKVQSKYDFGDRCKAVQHISTDFGEGNNFNSTNFIYFLKSFGRCLEIDIFDSIVRIIESAFSKNDQFLDEIKQICRQTFTKPSVSHIETQTKNLNIEQFEKIDKTYSNLVEIYNFFEKFAYEDDREAIDYAIKETYFYEEIFIKAHDRKNDKLVQFLIKSNLKLGDVLIEAAGSNDFDATKFLLSVPGINVNAKGYNGNTALIRATENHYSKIVKLLFAFPGIDVNAKKKMKMV